MADTHLVRLTCQLDLLPFRHFRQQHWRRTARLADRLTELWIPVLDDDLFIGS